MLSDPRFLYELRLRCDPGTDWDAYPFNIPAVRDIEQIEFAPEVTFFVGENGSGKSTVMEALAVALDLPSQGGSRNIARPDAEIPALQGAFELVRGIRKPEWSYFLRAESMWELFNYLDTLPPPRPPSMHRMSHGEAFLDVLGQLGRQGLYLMDEPEAALSPMRQLAALRRLRDLAAEGSQFVIATHSPILLAYPGARIFLFDGSGISETRYEDTEHFAITRDFLNHYPRRLQQLLADADDEG